MPALFERSADVDFVFFGRSLIFVWNCIRQVVLLTFFNPYIAPREDAQTTKFDCQLCAQQNPPASFLPFGTLKNVPSLYFCSLLLSSVNVTVPNSSRKSWKKSTELSVFSYVNSSGFDVAQSEYIQYRVLPFAFLSKYLGEV